jgi:two-component system nitrogen regulation response regulator GlnG
MPKSARNILLVEDDAAIATVIIAALEDEGFTITHCTSIAERDRLLDDGRFGVMLTDVILEDGDGLASLASMRERAPDVPVIVLSAQNTLDTAVRASESEAFEYFPKPFDLDELVHAVRQASAQRAKLVAADPEKSGEAEGDGDGEGGGEGGGERMPLVGRSPAMQTVYRMITRVLRNDLTVLITGESGTGKELVAEAIHQLGSRRTGPFVAVNTAAIPADLVESELFGHEKGAFTGAIAQAIGKFEQANGGTLFLDEIGDMPPEAQTRLLRALQSGRIRRVGGRQEIAVNVRIVAATNRDLAPMITAGTFREDLFYRLNVVPIELPPLRERREDIGALAQHFLVLAAEDGLPRRHLTPEAIARLEARSWRGNVRELRNVVYRLALMAREERIDVASLTDIIGEEVIAGTGGQRPTEAGFGPALAAWLANEAPPSGTLYHRALAAFEKPLIEHALGRTGGNQLRAAELLGINRNTLRKRIGELGLEPDRFSQTS